MKNVIFMILFICCISSAFGQSELDQMSRNAYLKTSETLWERTVMSAHQQYQKTDQVDDLFQWTVSQYALLNSTMSNKNQELFDRHVEQFDDNVDVLFDLDYRVAETKALAAAISGLKIAYAPWKGMILGPKSGFYMDEAVSGEPESALVNKLMGNYLFFTPEMWGGDLEGAIEYYQQSVKAFEKEGRTYEWMYLDTLAWLGQALYRQGEYNQAIAVYEKALQAAPEFVWVKTVLLPAAEVELGS
jgi:tetratricopeptide (TPR) repeat protein